MLRRLLVALLCASAAAGWSSWLSGDGEKEDPAAAKKEAPPSPGADAASKDAKLPPRAPP